MQYQFDLHLFPNVETLAVRMEEGYDEEIDYLKILNNINFSSLKNVIIFNQHNGSTNILDLLSTANCIEYFSLEEYHDTAVDKLCRRVCIYYPPMDRAYYMYKTCLKCSKLEKLHVGIDLIIMINFQYILTTRILSFWRNYGHKNLFVLNQFIRYY